MTTSTQTIFHETYKEQFLTDMHYSESTKRVVRVLLHYISEAETFYQKDVSRFKKEEFEFLWKQINATSVRSLQNKINDVEKYCLYLNQKLHTPKNHCFVRFFNKSNDIYPYVSKERTLFTADEIYHMAFTTENAQDGVLLILLFGGLSFKHSFNELISLHINDVTDKGIEVENRFLPFSFEQIQLIKKAHQQNTYQNSFGDCSRQYTLPTSLFVLKGLRGKKQVTPAVIHQRLGRLAKKYGLTHLNASNVSYSGQFELAKEIIEQGNTLEEALNEIQKRFNTIHNDSSLFRLRTKLKKDLYDMEIKD